MKSFSADSALAKALRKSLITEDNIMGVLRHCFLFTGDLGCRYPVAVRVLLLRIAQLVLAAAELDDDQKRDVIGAMVKREVVAGEIILRWGLCLFYSMKVRCDSMLQCNCI